MPLSELKGLSPELTAILESAGYRMLNDILDLEREDIAKIPGMTPESVRAAARLPRRAHRRGRRREVAAAEREPGCSACWAWGYRGRLVVVGVDAVRTELQAGKMLVRGGGGGRQPARRGQGGPAGVGARECRSSTGPRAAAIGAQLGKPPVMAVGVRDRALADGMVPPAPVRS